MLSSAEFALPTVPTANRFITDRVDEMTSEGFQMACKRRRTNTGQSDSEQRSVFMLCNGEDKLNIIFDEIVHIRNSQDSMYRGMLSFQSSFMNIGEKVNQVIQTTNRNTDFLKTLAYKSIDLEARSRRNNLIFWGLVENRSENCFALIRQFIKNELDLDSDKMYLARAHRLGPVKKSVGLVKRPLIVNFRDYCDTQAIMSNAHLLRGKPFSVDYDFPKEITTARKTLWNEIKSIKQSKPRANCQIVYPAKLLVDGKIVRDEFPEWSEALKGSRLGDFSHIQRVQESVFSCDPVCEIQEQMPGMHCSSRNRSENIHMSPVQVEISRKHSHTPKPDNELKCDETVPPLPPSPDDSLNMECSQSLISSNDNNIPSVPCTEPTDMISRPPPEDIIPRPSNPIFRPFNTDSDITTSTNNNTNSNTLLENPVFPERESRTKIKQRGYRRVHSLSIPRKQTKTGTSKDNVKPTPKNSVPCSPSRAQYTKETVTAHCANKHESVMTTDNSCSQHSKNVNTNEQC